MTERLLAQGLLTPAMLQELRKEWDANNAKNQHDEDDDDSPFSKKHRRRKPKKF